MAVSDGWCIINKQGRYESEVDGCIMAQAEDEWAQSVRGGEWSRQEQENLPFGAAQV